MLTHTALACAALIAVPAAAFADKAKGDYAEVNGVRLYYEVYGRGQPLIMLHGGITPSEQFGPNIEALAKGHKVIAVHLRGHGKSSDVDGPFRFEKLADDIAELAAKLKLTNVDVLGHSFGGGVAWQLAIRHPALVRKLVIVGEVMKRDGWYPEVVSGFEQMAKNPKKLGDQMAKSPLAKQYPDVQWEHLFQKIGDAEIQSYDWSKSVAALKMPVMLVFSDADAVRSDHIMEIWKALGGGARDPGIDGSLRPKTRRLAIIPNTTHYDVMKTSAVADVVAPFLDDKTATSGE